MGGTIDAMSTEFSNIDRLNTLIPDAEYGFATYDDYAYGSFGSYYGDKPFLLQQITDNVAAVQAESRAWTFMAAPTVRSRPWPCTRQPRVPATTKAAMASTIRSPM